MNDEPGSTAMKRCPLTAGLHPDGSIVGGACVPECAWWVPEDKNCAVATLARTTALAAVHSFGKPFKENKT